MTPCFGEPGVNWRLPAVRGRAVGGIGCVSCSPGGVRWTGRA